MDIDPKTPMFFYNAPKTVFVDLMSHFSVKFWTNYNFWASLKSSDYYWPEPEAVALGATGQVSTLTEPG